MKISRCERMIDYPMLRYTKEVLHTTKMIVLIISICTASMLFTGCVVNDLPGPVGSEFVTDTLLLTSLSSETSPLITSTLNGRAHIPIGNGNFFIGRTTDLEMFSFVRFTMPIDSFPDIQERDIISCTLTMAPVLYGYGNIQTGRLAFRAVQVLQPWNRFATQDTLAQLQRQGQIYGTRSLLSYNGVGILQSSQAVIQLPFDRTLATQWLAMTDSAQKAQQYGLAFFADPSSSVISSFFGNINEEGTTPPIIEIRFRRPADTIDRLRRLVGFQQASFSRPLQSFTQNGLIMQGASGLRSKIFFDVSRIPPLAIVHRADIFLTPDSLRSNTGTEKIPVSIVARVAADTSFIGSNFFSDRQVIARDEITGRYTANITQLIQRWSFGRTNNGLILSLNDIDENSQATRLVLFDRTADSTRRPLLRLLYSRIK